MGKIKKASDELELIEDVIIDTLEDNDVVTTEVESTGHNTRAFRQ
jgi:hypothetical protein